MRTRDTTRRCFICTKLGYLGNNYMNARRIENEKEDKSNNIKKEMRQKQILKSSKNASLSNEANVTQELGDSSIST